MDVLDSISTSIESFVSKEISVSSAVSSTVGSVAVGSVAVGSVAIVSVSFFFVLSVHIANGTITHKKSSAKE